MSTPPGGHGGYGPYGAPGSGWGTPSGQVPHAGGGMSPGRSRPAKSPDRHYKRDEHARILRRVGVRTWHFRGAGAHGVLRVAAEQGRRLDHSYPADPNGELHLCRPEDPARRG